MPTSHDSTTVLAPQVDSTRADLAGFVTSMTSITAWSHAVLNSELFPPDPKPDWFDGIVSHLRNAQEQAKTFVNTLQPTISSTVPQGVIDYEDLFQPSGEALERLVGKAVAAGGTPTAGDLEMMRGILGSLSSAAADQGAKADRLEERYSRFLTALSAALKALSGSTDEISAALGADEKQIADIRERIGKIREQIARDSEEATPSEMNSAFTVIALVIGLAAAVASGGALLPLVGIGLGVVNIGRTIAMSAIYSDKVAKDLEDLFKELDNLGTVEQQVSALHILQTSIEGLQQATVEAQDYLPRFSALWQETQQQIDSVLQTLQQPSVDLRLIGPLNDLSKAATDWATLKDASENVQRAQLTMQTDTSISIPPETDARKWLAVNDND